jgi:peptidoglycan/LPS O-acetylase OafA/YrhL
LNKRIKPLDGLRAIAAFGVVWIHTWGTYSSPSLNLFSVNLYRLIAIAGNGVDFFFVISGFCMYLILGHKEFNKHSYFDFLYRRFLRIAPAFYLSVLIYALLIKISFDQFSFWYDVFFHLLFLNNIVTGNTISGPFWSICTEWHFYMLLPFFICVSAKVTFIKTLVLFSFFSIIMTCFMNAGYLDYKWWEQQILIRFSEFAVGIGSAYIYLQKKRKPILFVKYGIFIGIIIMYFGRLLKFTPVLQHAGQSMFLLKSLADPIMTFGFGIILLHVVTQKSLMAKWLSGTIINYLGRISYSIYLWHSLSIIILSPILFKLPFKNLNVIPAFLLISFTTIIISHFSYRYLEAFYFKRKKNLPVNAFN